MTLKFPTDLLHKLFPSVSENRFYKDKDDHCSAHIDDRHKCVNFEPVPHTHNCCKYLMVTGECDFKNE